MPDVQLSPADVKSLTGQTVTDTQVDLAENVIHSETGFTVTQHRDTRNIPEINVRQAWAEVAGRLARRTATDPTDSLTSESQDDYSYSKDTGGQTSKFLVYPNILAGEPSVYLNWAPSYTTRAREPLPTGTGDTRPPVIDDYGVVHPRT